MENIPFYISIIFIITTFLSVFIFYKATNNSKIFLAVILTWLAVQSVISLAGFYKVTNTLPPRFALLIVPPVLCIIILFSTSVGRKFIDNLNPKFLILIHTVRIPVEIILFWLCLYKVVPQIMTIEGRNLDILSGLSALVIYYFGFIKKTLSDTMLLIWNFICLGLLINIIVIAILSAPFVFQKFALDQPNVALLYFPFIWLPCCIVPLVLFSHLTLIRQLILKRRVNKSVISLSI